ncbi:unnamed protein product [Closterium sp. NIES-53]
MLLLTEIFPWLYLFRVAVVPAEQAVAQETFRLQGQLDDLQTTLRRTQERERELSNLLSERDAKLAALNQQCAEAIQLNEQLLQDLSAAQGTALIGAPRPALPLFNMERIPRDANGTLIIPALVSHDNHFGQRPNKEALAMQKVSERRFNVNADAKVYGRGPVVYGPGANWHFCATSNRPFANLVFQLTLLRGLASKRATMLHVKIPTVGYILNVVEWPLVNARGRQNLPLDTAEAVNRQNVAHKIDQVVAWIAATYNAGDVAIWDSRRPAGFNMGPKILVEGYERVILSAIYSGFLHGTVPS